MHTRATFVVCSTHFKTCSVFLFHLFSGILGRPKRSLCSGILALSGSTAGVLWSEVRVSVHTEFEPHGKRYTCNPSIRTAHRNTGDRKGLLDTLITFIFHLLICAQGIVRSLDRRPQIFATIFHFWKKYPGQTPNTSPQLSLQRQRSNKIEERMWDITTFDPRLSWLELSSYRGTKEKGGSSMVSPE